MLTRTRRPGCPRSTPSGCGAEGSNPGGVPGCQVVKTQRSRSPTPTTKISQMRRTVGLFLQYIHHAHVAECDHTFKNMSILSNVYLSLFFLSLTKAAFIVVVVCLFFFSINRRKLYYMCISDIYCGLSYNLLSTQ